MDCQRQILDELMGKSRNLSMAELKKKNERYYNDDVCKNQLVVMCFNELFPNTTHDEGQCKLRHDPIFQMQFNDDDSLRKLKHEKKYLNDAINYVETKVNDVDAKIKQKKIQLEGTAPVTQEAELSKEVVERIEQLEMEIRKLLAQSTLLGEQGALEESEALAEKADQLRMQKEEAIRHSDNPQMSKDQKVCEVCGAFQAANDTDKRQQTHLEGKIHQGFLLLRSKLIELKKRREELKIKIEQKQLEEGSASPSPQRDKKKKKEKKSKTKKKGSRSRSYSKGRSRSRSVRDSRDREKDRDRKHKKKSKKSRRYSDSY